MVEEDIVDGSVKKKHLLVLKNSGCSYRKMEVEDMIKIENVEVVGWEDEE